jgi:hypothetical protein
LSVDDFDAAFTAHRPTTKEIISFSYAAVSLIIVSQSLYLAHNVKRICHQCQRSNDEPHTQFKDEKGSIYPQHNRDAR